MRLAPEVIPPARLLRLGRKALCEAGIDVVWSGDWPEDPGDEEILAFAHSEGRVLVTLDPFGLPSVVP